MRQSRWVPQDKFPFNGDINVVGDYVVMVALSGTKPIGITINSKEIAKGMRALFELAWTAAEKYN